MSSSVQVIAGQADREKRLVAFSSVLAAILLTTMKTVVGILTGSLGILSEAAHSGLDLVAAAVTYFAVRLSGKPADQDHSYGHGKVENLSALFETFLLLVTCIWIIFEAIKRLFFTSVAVEATIWSFLIMSISIIVDFSRSRALYYMARKHKSQALEADALHFSTDIWSSSVVIGGLALVAISGRLKLPWLIKADAIAALGVAGIVVYVSLQLGKKTIADLIDTIPPGMRGEVEKSAHVPGVLGVKHVRVRRSGPEIFTDVTLLFDPNTSLQEAHSITSKAEAAIRKAIPGADVVVHMEPAPVKTKPIMKKTGPK